MRIWYKSSSVHYRWNDFFLGKVHCFIRKLRFRKNFFACLLNVYSWFQWKWLAILNFSIFISFASKNTKTETPSLLVSALRVGWPRKKWVKKMINKTMYCTHPSYPLRPVKQHNDKRHWPKATGGRRGPQVIMLIATKAQGNSRKWKGEYLFYPVGVSNTWRCIWYPKAKKMRKSSLKRWEITWDDGVDRLLPWLKALITEIKKYI